jgi:hypothetical protein
MTCGHPGTGYPFPLGDLRLVLDLACIELPSPFDRHAEEFDYPGRLGLPGRRRFAPTGRDRAPHPIGSYQAR